MENSEIYELKDKVNCYENRIADMQAHIDCLKSELLEVQSHAGDGKVELPIEPIDVATTLIRETVTLKASPFQKCCNPNMPDEYEVEKYSKADLHQIAEHLLVYCNNNADRN